MHTELTPPAPELTTPDPEPLPQQVETAPEAVPEPEPTQQPPAPIQPPPIPTRQPSRFMLAWRPQSITLEEFWREADIRPPTIGERDQDNLETLLAVVLDPEDARHFAAAVSDRGIITAAAPQAYPGALLPGGNPDALRNGRFSSDDRERAEQMHHHIRNIAELAATILASETDIDRAVREAKEILMRVPKP